MDSSDEERIDVSPVGFGIALIGALAMLIAIFLPRVESTSFGGVAENTLIQNGDGWIYVALSIGIAGAAYRAFRRGTKTVAVIVMGLIAVGVAIYHGTDEELLTLYPVNPNGEISAFAEGRKASPAAGIYLAGLGGLLAVVGGFQMRTGARIRETSQAPEEQPTKTCPDCAETVLAAARVCRYCGHEFRATGTAEWIPTPSESDGRGSRRWRCDLCNAVFEGRYLAELHAERDHAERTTEDAKKALVELPG